MKRENEIGLIILAAGASVRFGAPKQSLKFHGETLLRRIVRESLASVCCPVVVVLSDDAGKFANELKGLNVFTAENANWKTGMGSSVKTGLGKLLEIKKSVEAVVLTVCDQPFVTELVINQLVETYCETQSPIVASAYRETLGVPALFSRKLFPRLSKLGNGGAKQIIKQFQAETKSVPFPAGAIDIDTPEDYAEFCS